ncbi:hypothetical protein [Treponema sp. C6A8]|uniref:hypothetical protein n=1 Tax=Treponema sp. C6A8 TaxID=1410609 RepID=UPI000488396A|nr:hypothetical protein [Treponema sp. C6A8]
MKARIKRTLNITLSCMFVACFVILNPSCGLDEYYVLNGPSSIFCPVYSESNPLTFPNKYVEFTTNPSDSSEGSFSVDGTDVYYKIYSNYSTCASEYSALNVLANNASTKASSASSLINSYKFQKLKNNSSSDDTFVNHDGSAVRVKIRLTQYLQEQDKEEYRAFIKFNEGKVGVPVRYYGSRYFDFVRYTNYYSAPLPRSTYYEDDVSTNTSVTKENCWYVTLYAFTKGHDSSFTTYYSPICHLGTLCIVDNTYEN